MKRRFAIPAAIALTAHAVLFMGYGRPPAGGTKPPSTVIDTTTTILIDDNTPPVPVEPGDEPSEGLKFDGPPGIPELPPTDFPKGAEITQPYVPFTPGPSDVIVPRLSVKNPGDGNGNKLVGVELLDNKPRTCFQKSPVYPRALQNAGETGTVWVDFMVDERGYVHDARIVKSSNRGFDDATLEAISAWRFEPGKRNGIPVRFRMSLPLVFSITS